VKIKTIIGHTFEMNYFIRNFTIVLSLTIMKTTRPIIIIVTGFVCGPRKQLVQPSLWSPFEGFFMAHYCFDILMRRRTRVFDDRI